MNDLYYQKNKNSVLPVNLWGHPKSLHVNKTFATSGYCTVLDLPLLKGKIDFKSIQEVLPKGTSSVFMTCYRLQSIFSKYFLQSTPGSNQILDDLVQQSKSLLLNHGSEMLSLSKWERFFHTMPLMRAESEMVFMHMIHKCKYTKFCEINFKILAHILVTLKILSHIHKNPSLERCPWCTAVGTLEHCFLVT